MYKLITHNTTETTHYNTKLIAQEKPIPKESEVLIKVHYSSLNYKDMLAITGRGKILRSFPLTPGIDLSGEVIESLDERWRVGDKVIVTGCGLGEVHDGGLASYACVPANWLIKLPDPWTLLDAMRLGTAGFTAGMALEKFLQNKITPNNGKIAITGATGGVGLWSLILLKSLGFKITAFTRDVDKYAHALTAFGADEILALTSLTENIKLLNSMEYAAVIDQVGGDALACLLSKTKASGHVFSVGLALSANLNTSVMPFILRGITLQGLSSSNCPYPVRKRIWEMLAMLVHTPEMLEKMPVKIIKLDEVIDLCENWESTIGRVIVKL